MTSGCQIYLIGPLRVIAPDGRDITPKAAKSKGLIALLVASPNHIRSRRWLESKLWSDRGQQQAQGSLRQALRDIRDDFGDDIKLLDSDRVNVWLHSESMTVDLDGATGCPEGKEILEGIDIRDPGFDQFLRSLRQRFSPAPSVPTVPATFRGIRLRCIATGAQTQAEELVAQSLADQVGRNIEDGLSAWRIDDQGTEGGQDDIQISTTIALENDQVLVSVRVVHLRSQRVLFSGLRQRPVGLTGLLSDDFVLEFAHDAASRSILKLPVAIGLDLPEAIGAGFANIALRRLRTFDGEQLTQADDLMARAYDASRNGVYLGWRSFFRMAQVVEGHATPDQLLLEEADAMGRQAVEQAPENALALALAGMTRTMLFDDIETGFKLSEAAVRCNPNSLFARQAYAVACGASGQFDKAYSLSSFCQPALVNEDMRHLWDLYHSLVCISTGRLEEAYSAAKRASASCPSFLAPRRQIVGLAVKFGDLNTARKQLLAIESRETGFSIDRFLNDDSYPVDTMRRANLLRFSPQLLDG